VWRRGQDIDDEKMSNGAERLLAKSGFIEMENEVRVIFPFSSIRATLSVCGSFPYLPCPKKYILKPFACQK